MNELETVNEILNKNPATSEEADTARRILYDSIKVCIDELYADKNRNLSKKLKLWKISKLLTAISCLYSNYNHRSNSTLWLSMCYNCILYFKINDPDEISDDYPINVKEQSHQELIDSLESIYK